MPSKDKQAEVNSLAQILTKLVYIFRRGGEASDYNWWNKSSSRSIFYPIYGYEDGRELYEQVVQGILSLNPDMLSEYEVNRRLMFDFLEDQTISVKQEQHLKDQKLISEASNFIKRLIEFKAYHDIDIPIANLWHNEQPVEFLDVTFRETTNDELKTWEKKLSAFWHEGTKGVHILARVKAPGDEQKAIDYARNKVNAVLEVFRAFCFPFGKKSNAWRVGVVGDIISYTSTPMSIDGSKFLSRIGNGIMLVELNKHILSVIEQKKWDLISNFILKTQHNKMEKKVHDSIHWLAESTKPDTNNSKFAKISFALETLIGGEASEEDLKVRGITAMLAERAAFIAGKDLEDRQSIDKEIRKFYGMRSGIVHGSEGEVSLDDIDNFGQIVRRLALSILDKIDKLGDEINTVDKLESWVKLQRYTLLEDTTKEVT